MSTETVLARWLRNEMPRRGYALDGPRAGGISRLAQDTGISQAAMSRMVNGQQEPTIGILRKLGSLFGIPLGQMMVNAGLAGPDEMVTHFASATLFAASTVTATAEVIPAQPEDLPEDVDWAGLTKLERYVWLAPGAPVHLRQAWIDMMGIIARATEGARPGLSGEHRRSV